MGIFSKLFSNNIANQLHNECSEDSEPCKDFSKSCIAIDFETATAQRNSACSIGIVVITDLDITYKEYFLIQPPQNKYDSINTSIHGITPEMTKNCETFPAVWQKINHYFDNTFVVAHNARFDMEVLKATLKLYKIDFPDFKYFDSMTVGAHFADSDKFTSKKLGDLCDCYGIELDNHHDALCDAIACASIVIGAIKNSRYVHVHTFINGAALLKNFCDVKEIKATGYRQNFHKDLNISKIMDSIKDSDIIIDDDFNNKVFAFTEELNGIEREDAYRLVMAGGGYVNSSVTLKTDYLVNADTVLTGKVKRAVELQEKGHHIKIITGEQFMKMMESPEAIVL